MYVRVHVLHTVPSLTVSSAPMHAHTDLLLQTVYEKGAQVIRMYETLLGKDGFRKGMDLYFSRHDGQVRPAIYHMLPCRVAATAVVSAMRVRAMGLTVGSSRTAPRCMRCTSCRMTPPAGACRL